MASKGNSYIPSATLHKLFKLGKVGFDAVGLYSFYQYTAMWQDEKWGTKNRPEATRQYCKSFLGMGTERHYNADKLLRKLGLIVKRKFRKKNGSFGYAVELPFYSPESQLGQRLSAYPQSSQPTTADRTPNTDGKDRLNTDGKYNFSEPKFSLPDKKEHREQNMPAASTPLDTLKTYLTDDELAEIMHTMGVEKNDVRQALDNCIERYDGKPTHGMTLNWLKKKISYLDIREGVR